MEPSSKRIKLSENMRLKSVLSDELINEIPLINVYVAVIINKKDISKIILELNTKIPIPDLQHLKRVSKNEIIINKCENVTVDISKYLINLNIDTNCLKEDFKIVEVCSIPPKLKWQYDIVHKLWPCNFHSDKYLEKLYNNDIFNENDIVKHEKYMEIAIQVSEFDSSESEVINIGGVAVDPNSSSVAAVAFDQRKTNPTQHCAMVLIDNVAKTQKGGAWFSNLKIEKDILSELKSKFSNVKFGVEELLVDKNDSNFGKKIGPYLCTGYDIYLTHEPCLMCAMALTHSRVRRVFYGARTENGGLGSTVKLHTVKELNHHFEVFEGLLVEECSKLNK